MQISYLKEFSDLKISKNKKRPFTNLKETPFPPPRMKMYSLHSNTHRKYRFMPQWCINSAIPSLFAGQTLPGLSVLDSGLALSLTTDIAGTLLLWPVFTLILLSVYQYIAKHVPIGKGVR